ncbi:MAG: hypothetical protein E7399_06495 [Ruminococcaceae bacterium]|nr:hypothetical protein [Oscillospiraceae bacterium]
MKRLFIGLLVGCFLISGLTACKKIKPGADVTDSTEPEVTAEVHYDLNPTNFNAENYEALKNIILTQGTKSEINEDYYMSYDMESNMSFSVKHVSATDEIAFFLNFDLTNTTTMIVVCKDGNPRLTRSEKTFDDEECFIFAEFQEPDQPYVEIENQYDDALKESMGELVNSELRLMNSCLQLLTNMSFSDFGIYFEE